jgi:hypothetical protein
MEQDQETMNQCGKRLKKRDVVGQCATAALSVPCCPACSALSGVIRRYPNSSVSRPYPSLADVLSGRFPFFVISRLLKPTINRISLV